MQWWVYQMKDVLTLTRLPVSGIGDGVGCDVAV